MSKEYSYLNAKPYDTNMAVPDISEIYYSFGEIMALSFDKKISKKAIKENIKAINTRPASGEMAEDISTLLDEVEQAISSKNFPASLIYNMSCVRRRMYLTMLDKESVA